MDTIYANTILDIECATDQHTLISEELIATAEDLAVVWRYFRMKNKLSILAYGYPCDNAGHDIVCEPILTESQLIQIEICKKWFISFSAVESVKILRIETPLGGLLIRKTLPGECRHKFVTMDLPMCPEMTVSVITFDR